MKENFAEVLESYIIDDIATEGLHENITAIAGIAGFATLLYAIKNIYKNFKKTPNKEIDGETAVNMLNKFSNHINGILEPVNGSKYLNLYSKKVTIAKSAENIRKSFCKISPTDNNAEDKYNKLYSQIIALKDKATAIDNALKAIDLGVCEENLKPLYSTNINKLLKMEDELFILWDCGGDGNLFITTDTFANSEIFEEVLDNPEADKCISAFDSLVNILIKQDGYVDTKRYLSKCKYSIKPDAGKEIKDTINKIH